MIVGTSVFITLAVLFIIALLIAVSMAWIAEGRTNTPGTLYTPYGWVPAVTSDRLIVSGPPMVSYTGGGSFGTSGVTGPAIWSPDFTLVGDFCISFWSSGAGDLSIGGTTLSVGGSVTVGAVSAPLAGRTHIVWTRTGRTDRLYLDGVQVAAYTFDTGEPMSLPVGQLAVGAGLTVADLRIYRCSFTDGVVALLFEQGRLI